MLLRQSMAHIARCIRSRTTHVNKSIYSCSLIARSASILTYRPWQDKSVNRTIIPSPFKIRSYSSDSNDDATKRVGQLVKSSRIVVFMKGNPAEPRCGFSNAVCRILEMHGILEKATQAGNQELFSSYDVLADEQLRAAAKIYSDWPTFPQVFFDGEFIGGCDILLEMHRSGKLASELERLGIGSALKQVSNEDSS